MAQGASWRVWLVVFSAISVIVFLAVSLPGVFELEHSRRSFQIARPIKRLMIVSEGTLDLKISPSRDGRVHIDRASSISRDSSLFERRRLAGKTLTLRSSCSGSRLGILRWCELDYELKVPAKIGLSIRMHIGRVRVRGIRGPVEIEGDGGDLRLFGCNRNTDLSLTFGHMLLDQTCVPDLVRARMRSGEIDLTVPAGRYRVHADTHFGDGVERPFANLIEDASSPHVLDLELSWGGEIRIAGAEDD